MIIGTQNPPAISTDWPRPAEKDIRTVGRPMLYVVTKAYQLHVFLSRANLNFQESLKHSSTGCKRVLFGAHTEQRLTDNTQTPKQVLLPSHPPAPERTNTPHQFKHTNTKRRVIQHLRTVFSAHGEPRLKPLNNELSFASSCF